MAQAPRSSRLAQDKTSSSSAPRPAATTSELMCRLVNSRDKVFEMQRGCRDGKRAAASQKAVAAHIAKLSPTSTCSAAWRNYSRFCVAQRVPSFPIPSPMLALWLHDKCSSLHHYPKSYQSLLEGCASAANHVWAGEPSFEALSKLDPTGQAVREFMSERKVLWNRRALATSLTLTTPSVSSSSTSRSTAPDTPDAASSRSRASLRPRAGPSVAPPPSSSRALRWKSRAERKAADEQAELESDEAEVFIPRKKRLRRGKRRRSSRSDEASSSLGSSRKKNKRVRLELFSPTFSSSPTPPLLTRRRTVISSSESSSAEASDFESASRSRSRWAPSPSTAPRKRSSSPELKGFQMKAHTSFKVKERLDESIKRPKLEEDELDVEHNAVCRSIKDNSSGLLVQVSSDEPLASLSTTARSDLADLPFSLPPSSSPKPALLERAATCSWSGGHAPSFEAGSSARARADPAVHSAAASPLSPLVSPILDIRAFLVSLHPSLESLTSHLVDAGFDSVASLAWLALLEPPVLKITLDVVRVEASRRAGAQRRRGERVWPLSVIQLKLLERRLGEEGEALRS